MGAFRQGRGLKGPALKGRVVRGLGVGRKLGFPTANLSVPPSRLPPFGVYFVEILGPGKLKGTKALASVGVRPTVSGSGQPLAEIYIPGFVGRLYGRILRVAFIKRIRPELKLPSLAALKARIRADLRVFKRLCRKPYSARASGSGPRSRS